MSGLPPGLQGLLAAARVASGRIVVLTGAGISAESGIPTFRGPEGYWRVGSGNYRAEELATAAAFARMPAAIWGWYLYRRGVCTAAAPNAAHLALVRLDAALGERVLLVTQNVDGLHLRAGHPAARVFEVHGNLHFARCTAACTPPGELPAALGTGWPKDRVPTDAATLRALHCRRCGAWLRPHVLWFDEHYDEANYRFESSLRAVQAAALLLVVGTSGTTNLPTFMLDTAAARRVPLVVVDPEESRCSELVRSSPVGYFARGKATEWVPAIAAALAGESPVRT